MVMLCCGNFIHGIGGPGLRFQRGAREELTYPEGNETEQFYQKKKPEKNGSKEIY
jgi:hypothetical protein